jgi:hypothetical protein
VLLVSEMKARRILTDIEGVNGPFHGPLVSGVPPEQQPPGAALMCILGPSGAGATVSADIICLPTLVLCMQGCLHLWQHRARRAAVGCWQLARRGHKVSATRSHKPGGLVAGKSSLLDIISGRRDGPSVRARLFVNGVPVTASKMRSASGYVHQVRISLCGAARGVHTVNPVVYGDFSSGLVAPPCGACVCSGNNGCIRSEQPIYAG